MEIYAYPVSAKDAGKVAEVIDKHFHNSVVIGGMGVLFWPIIPKGVQSDIGSTSDIDLLVRQKELKKLSRKENFEALPIYMIDREVRLGGSLSNYSTYEYSPFFVFKSNKDFYNKMDIDFFTEKSGLGAIEVNDEIFSSYENIEVDGTKIKVAKVGLLIAASFNPLAFTKERARRVLYLGYSYALVNGFEKAKEEFEAAARWIIEGEKRVESALKKLANEGQFLHIYSNPNYTNYRVMAGQIARRLLPGNDMHDIARKAAKRTNFERYEELNSFFIDLLRTSRKS
ncbi:MAG: hypothetical protein ACP5SA_03270 [Candidatus Micrarchaeia archaeon]